PHSPEAAIHKTAGAVTDAPFLSPAGVLAAPEAGDFIGAGDFDADGRLDVVTAARGGTALYLLRGDGNGGLQEPKKIELPGTLSALVVGEINRRDGLADIAAAVMTPRGAKALVFEGPEGALTAEPEIFTLPAEATSLALGQLDEYQELDLAVAAGHDLMVISGRDRKLSLDARDRAQVASARVETRSFPFAIKSLEIGDFTGRRQSCLAMLTDSAELVVLSPGDKRRHGLKAWSQEHMAISGDRMATARISSSPADEMIVLDRRAVRVVTHTHRDVEEEQAAQFFFSLYGGHRESAEMQVEGDPVAVLGMRLNSGALDDLVMLTAGSPAIVLVTGTIGAVITVNSNLDNNERDNKLTLREAILISNGELLVAALTPAEQAQVVGTPGPLDRIEFNINTAISSLPAGSSGDLTAGLLGGGPAGLMANPLTYVVISAVVDWFGQQGDVGIASQTVAGALDPTFDGDGRVTTSFSSFYAQANAVAIQTDGKIVAAGFSGSSSKDFAVARYNTNGSLDSSFGTGGIVTTSFGIDPEVAYAVAIQTDGKIVAAGSANGTGESGVNNKFALARYDTNGVLDNSFGVGGKVTTSFLGGGLIRAIAIQTDNKIVAAGQVSPNIVPKDFILARYNSDGSLDSTFGSGGIVTTDFISDDCAQAVVLQPDGRIVAAGYTGQSVDFVFAVARYNSNGSLDATFGNSGKVVTDFAGTTIDQAFALVRQPDGMLIAGGQATNNFGNGMLALARYNLDGSLDVSFNGNGRVTTDLTAGQDLIGAVALQSDGRVVVASQANRGALGTDFALERYNCDGTLDTTFDGDGKVTTDFSGATDHALAVAIQTDGRIVAAGYSSTNSILSDFALARYDGGTGTPCNGGCTYSITPASQTFAQSGGTGAVNVTAGIGCPWTAVSNASWISITSGSSGSGNGSAGFSVPVNNGATRTGTITVAGFTFLVSQGGVGSPPGSQDATFGTGGKVTTTFPNFYSQVYATAIQQDGKIVTAGVSGNFNDNLSGDFALARYNADGSLDSSFGTGGKVTTPFFSFGTDIAYAVAIQTDGKIVAAGYARNSNSGFLIALARYNTDGSLDTTFDRDGKVTANPPAGGVARGVVIQNDGRIVIAGHEDTIFSDN